MMTFEELVAEIRTQAEKHQITGDMYLKVTIPVQLVSEEMIVLLGKAELGYRMIPILGCNSCPTHKANPLPHVVLLALTEKAINAAQARYWPELESEGYIPRLMDIEYVVAIISNHS